jgi:hypothetical protein
LTWVVDFGQHSGMTKIDGSRLIAHLRQKWAGRPCQMCGVGNWNVQETTFELREFNEGNLVVGGVPIIPVVPVICSNCGNTVLVNALSAGVIPPPAEAKP